MTEPIIAQFMLPITTKETVQELMQQGCNWGKTIGAIAELEKLKAEITEYRSKHNCGVIECLDFIDNHIEKLKGENNGETTE